jgi:hypothetical protein
MQLLTSLILKTIGLDRILKKLKNFNDIISGFFIHKEIKI